MAVIAMTREMGTLGKDVVAGLADLVPPDELYFTIAAQASPPLAQMQDDTRKRASWIDRKSVV